MKKLILIISLIVMSFLLACTQNQPIACTADAKICPDGTAVGRVGPNCEFAPCPNNQSKQNYCSAIEHKGDVCAEIYKPVCGWFDPEKIQCIRYPCAQTFSNECFACHDEKVLYWTEGECPE